MKSKCSLVVLAAGQSSRFGRPKQLEAVGPSGETLLEYTLFDAVKLGIDHVVFILNRQIEAIFSETIIQKIHGKITSTIVCQDTDSLPSGSQYSGNRSKPWGTGHALWSAAARTGDSLIVVNADDFYGRETLGKMVNFFSGSSEEDTYCMMGFLLRNTLSEAGPVSRGICRLDHQMCLKSLEEKTHIEARRNHIMALEDDRYHKLDPNALVSMNLWGFRNSVFTLLENRFRNFLERFGEDEQKEFFLPSVIHSAVQDESITVHVLKTESKWFGMTYESELDTVRTQILNRITQKQYPEKLWA